jgi:hypothetical protein
VCLVPQHPIADQTTEYDVVKVTEPRVAHQSCFVLYDIRNLTTGTTSRFNPDSLLSTYDGGPHSIH